MEIAAGRGPGKRFAQTLSLIGCLAALAAIVVPATAGAARFVVGPVSTSADGDVTLSVSVPGPGVVNVLETAWLSNEAHTTGLLAPAHGRFVYARAHRSAHRRSALELTVTPNARGRRLIAHHAYGVTLRVWITYKPAHGVRHKIGLLGLHL